MAWEVSVQFDEDKTNVGSVTAVFTDVDTRTFAFSQRVKADAGVVASFVAAAIAARDAWQTRKAAQASAIDTVKARFVTVGELVT